MIHRPTGLLQLAARTCLYYYSTAAVNELRIFVTFAIVSIRNITVVDAVANNLEFSTFGAV